jgi:WD40 repeat protein
MRTLLERVGLSPEAPSGGLYHGFISYSHAADGKLAPALQKGLQRFAKPWYRTRALHVFRDETELAANPDLWSSVTDALDASQYLILLASPKAAASHWVDKEAKYWCDNKGADWVDKILIGLTDGEFVWDGRAGRVDSERTDVLPPSLHDAFKAEPLYIDLKWAKNTDELGFTNSDWSKAIARLAAPLHGVRPGELAGEEVRQHRRTVRIARTAAVTVLTLLAAALVAGYVAYSQYRSAQARALAAEATSDLTGNPQHSLSLALQSTQINSSSTAIQALRSSLAQAPLRVTIASGAGASVQAAWSPVGKQIAVAGLHQEVQLWNPRTGRLQHVLRGTGGSSPIAQLLYSSNGQWLAAVTAAGDVEVWNVASASAVSTVALNQEVRASYPGNPIGYGGVSLLGTTVTWSIFNPDGLLVYGLGFGKLLLFDARSGTVGQSLGPLPRGTTGVNTVVPSPDGSRLFVALGSGAIVNVATGRGVALTPRVSMTEHEACWFADSKGLITWDPNEAQDLVLRWWNATSGKEVGSFPTPNTITAAACSQSAAQDWAATGTRDGNVLLHLVSGTTLQLSGHTRFITAMASSRNGDYLATASDDGTVRVWDTRTGAQLRLLSDGDQVTGVQFSPDAGLALTTDQLGVVRVWDTGVGEPLTRLALPDAGQTYPLGFSSGGKLVYGLNAVLRVHGLLGPGQPVPMNSASIVLWSSATGAIVRRIPLPTDLAAARVAANVPCQKQGLFLEACSLTPPSNLAVPLPVPGQFTSGVLGVAVNGGGSEVAYSGANGVRVIDADGRTLEQLALPQRPTGVSFSGGQIVVMTDQAVYVGRPSPTAHWLRLSQPSPPMDAELSANGARLVTADLDGTVTVWSTTSTVPLAVFHATRAFAAQVEQVSGGLISNTSEGGPPVPLRAAINADGNAIAVGTSWQTVFMWNVNDRRLVAAKFVWSPVDRGVGVAGAPTAGGFDGPWGIAELGFSADGSALVAVDYPIYTATDSEAPATGEVLSARGATIGVFQSPDVRNGAIDPGAALSPNGEALLAGVLPLSPGSSGRDDAIYQGSTGELLLGLQTADLPQRSSYVDWPSVAQPWAPNGIDLLAGDAAIYACDACGSVAQMEQAAQTRLAWQRPLSVAHDVPPGGNPYG